MGIPNLPTVPNNPTTHQLAEIVADLSQQLTYLLSGFLSSDNAREFGGWAVGKTELQSKDKTVGMSTDKTGVDPIRFWAGDVKDGSPNFIVTDSGKVVLKSDSGYPRIELNTDTGEISAYVSAGNGIKIVKTMFSGNPAITFISGGSPTGYIQEQSSEIVFTTMTGIKDINISSGVDLVLAADDEVKLYGNNLVVNGYVGYSGSFSTGTQTILVQNGIIYGVV